MWLKFNFSSIRFQRYSNSYSNSVRLKNLVNSLGFNVYFILFVSNRSLSDWYFHHFFTCFDYSFVDFLFRWSYTNNQTEKKYLSRWNWLQPHRSSNKHGKTRNLPVKYLLQLKNAQLNMTLLSLFLLYFYFVLFSFVPFRFSLQT